MSILYGIIYVILGSTLLTHFLSDGILKLVALITLSIYAFSWSSEWYAYCCTGLFLMQALGTPVIEQNNTCQLRRSYGLIFDILAIILLAFGTYKLIF
jgi:hypothetical protein|nr:MAG TPA: hypothetical protein [Caudoviricetes sp.]